MNKMGKIVTIAMVWVIGATLVFYWIMIPSMADDLRRGDYGYKTKTFVESVRYTFLEEKIPDILKEDN